MADLLAAATAFHLEVAAVSKLIKASLDVPDAEAGRRGEFVP